MSMKQLADLDFNSVSRALNLPEPSDPAEPATKGYVDSAVEGLSWKEAVVAASTSNVNLAAPGSGVDGVTLVQDDRVLIKDQSAASENGIYIFNGAASQMTRALDASTAEELEQAVVTVEEGTANGGATFRQSEVNFTLDTGDVTWSAFGQSVPSASESTEGKAEIATQAEVDAGTDDLRFVTPAKLAAHSGRKLKHTQQIGDGAQTSLAVTHNLGTRDVIVQVYRVGSPYETVNCEVERTDTNTVTCKFAAAPSSNQYKVVVLG